MSNIRQVIWGKRVEKQLALLPHRIVEKFLAWEKHVRLIGILEVRKRPGYHDEPLFGDRKGQRSIRLSAAYRAIYVEILDGRVQMIEVIEVNKHGY
jgi:proteic killer suppression protein